MSRIEILIVNNIFFLVKESSMITAEMQKLYRELYNKTHKKVIAVGRNYLEHARELGNEPPPEPVVFDKPVSSIIKSGNVMYLRNENEIHHEIMLGLIIGMKGKNINPRDYMAYIEGYFLGIDFTDRYLQNIAKKHSAPWTISKGQDDFLAVSGFVAKDKVLNPHNLDIELTLNGKCVQHDNTHNMIFKIPELLAYISKHMTLEEGDLVMTGTPSGVSPVHAGDFVQGSMKQGTQELASMFMKVEKAHK